MARKVKNFRDLGGIPAADGKSVCYGKLYRSGHLGKIKPEVAEKLRDRKGLRTVVDLRAPAELSHKRDIVPEGVNYFHLPPLTDEQNPAVTRHTGPSILKKIMKVEGGARTYLSDTYRTMISSEPSLRALREFFDVLLEDGGAVLWHCTQGKDRTGVVAAAILLAGAGALFWMWVSSLCTVLIKYAEVYLAVRTRFERHDGEGVFGGRRGYSKI